MVYRRAALLCLLCLGILLIAWWASARPPEPPSVAEAGHSSKPVVAAEPGDGEVRIEGDLMLGSGEPEVPELGTRTISSAGSSLEFEIRAVGKLVARAEVRLLDASVAVDGRWTSSPDGFEFRLGSVSELRVGPSASLDVSRVLRQNLVSTGATPPQGVHASYRGRDVPIEIVGEWTRLGGPELVGAASIWTATFRTSGVTEPAPWEPSLRVAADSGMSLRVVLPPSATVADRQTMSLGK